ncbi:gamma-glutamyltransferase [Rubrivivax gelatinosus]|uniref:Glutathione hydrolase proenzyme n=1 Tax=Rubrivivax gelatinosus TaxID=28068 RepID=A0A4R2MBM4_RUBGE|nr:gamma-glutamyltransferase [Rubrivivax gelatinosus]MBK1689654.1 gamma-glutamyltransferase [Rubrivivax gelatinosus]TCP01794.1 gamma-glutamyltransferase 1 [Rubrivivax gelatinosus]
MTLDSRAAAVPLAALLLLAPLAPEALARDVAKPGPRLAAVAEAAKVQGLKRGVVATANPYAAEAGARILGWGGNAIDAAVGIAYALNVVEPQSAGIGGGGFMMVHLAETGETFVLDSRETAPAGATPDMFVGVPSASLQGVAVGVPGMVRGTAWAVEHWGRLKLGQVVQPAIRLASQGFEATPRYVSASCNARARNSPEAEAFFCPGGVPPAVGQLIRNEPLAETLRLIATRGPDCFYVMKPELGCDIAKGIVEGQKFTRGEPGSKGGSMTYTDLQGYQPALRVPVEGRYRGWTLKSMPPPSSGGLTVLQMLAMVERFPIGDASQGWGFGEPKTVQTMVEAMRLAFADRAVWMGDDDFVHVPATGLLDPEYVAQRSAQIVPEVRAQPDPTAGDPRPYDVKPLRSSRPLAVAAPVNGPGETTTHFSVVDRWGNMVSYTNTIESSHGIGVFAGYTREDGSFRNFGFLLNNELTDFNLAPTVNPYTGAAGTNDVQPGKRPRSSMAPTMIFTPEGQPVVAYGSPGGATIINSVFNVTLNLVDHGMGLQQAIDAPRVSVASAGSNVATETAMPQSTVDALKALGYSVSITDIGSVQAVLVDPVTGRQYGAADARREGTVIALPRRQP